MGSVLRVYDPPECDDAGVPLDWERCRTCAGRGKVEAPGVGVMIGGVSTKPGPRSCVVCDGHGSLKAAGLAGVVSSSRYLNPLYERALPQRPSYPADVGAMLEQNAAYAREVHKVGEAVKREAVRMPRCEGCQHPMSEGTWEGGAAGPVCTVAPGTLPPYTAEEIRQLRDPEGLVRLLARGREPGELRAMGVHWSACDERCEHESSEATARVVEDGDARPPRGGGLTTRLLVKDERFTAVEASWRAVDVRALGWAHDLRPERLAVLCLRCWAARSR